MLDSTLRLQLLQQPLSDRAILLLTAKAITFNPSDPRVSQSVRIVLDTGSQRSYVTNLVKEKLALVPEGEQCM